MRSPGASARRKVALAGHVGDTATARDGLGHPDAAVRVAAIGALARIGALDLTVVSTMVCDPDPAVRARAAESAALLGVAAESVLVTALSDRHASVVESACFALGEIAPTSPPAPRPAAVAALSGVARTHPDDLCREAAVAAIGAIGDPAGLAAVIDAAADKPAVRRRAVLALAPFDGPTVDEALERALHDRDWQVRQAAEDLTGRRPAARASTPPPAAT